MFSSMFYMIDFRSQAKEKSKNHNDFGDEKVLIMLVLIGFSEMRVFRR